MHIDPDLLAGTWQLISAEFRREGEETIYPWGIAPGGFLFYDAASGYMSATLTARHLPSATQNFLSAEEEQVVRYLAYVGRYHIEGESIFHAVETCTLSGWVGKVHTRVVEELTREVLLLRCPPMHLLGKERVGYIQWGKLP